MRILAAVQLYPWPAVDGYRQRLRHVLRGLASVGEVDVFCLTPGDGEPLAQPQPEVATVVTSPLVQLGPTDWLTRWVGGDVPRKVESIDWSEARKVLEAWAPEVDLVWFSQVESWVALADHFEGVASIVDFDNLEDHLMQLRRFTPPQLTDSVRSDGAPAVAAVMARWATSRAFDLVDQHRFTDLYKRCSDAADHVVVCSELDAQRSGLPNVEVVPNGGESSGSVRTDRRELRGERPVLSFVGALDYEPNTDAVEWFVSEVLPIIRERIPQVQVRVVGRGQECISVDRTTPGLVFTGRVEDLDAELDLADVAIVPIRLGAGTRLKVIEAMASHIPMVSTTVGCEGIDLMNGDDALLADDPRRFADACLRLISDGSLRQRLADNAAALFERRYRWDAIEDRIGELALKTVEGHSRSPGRFDTTAGE